MKFLSNNGLFALLLLVGMYFPTSGGGVWAALLPRASFMVSAALLVIVALRAGADESIFLWFSVPIVIWLIVCTLLSLRLLHELTLTSFALFCFFGLMLLVRAGRLRCRNLTPILAIVSIANVCMAVSMLTVESFGNFMVTWYNDFADGMMEGMIAIDKPVLTFAVHSLAGLFVYLFFWLNLRTYQRTGKRLHLVLAVFHVALCIVLMSTTSIALGLLAIAELAWNFKWTVTVSATATFFLLPVYLKETIWDGFLSDIWFREGGGFRARYEADGILANALTYIHNHPFQPIGLLGSRNLFNQGIQTDSPPLMYFLRGSFILVLLMYGGLFLYLKRNLGNKWDCYRLFFLVLVTEVGISVLTYPRSFLLIPAFVIYLNSLPAESPARAAGLESAIAVPYSLPQGSDIDSGLTKSS